MEFLLYVIPPLLLGLWAQHSVKKNFRDHLEQPVATGMTGAQVARMILDRNGLSEVPVEEVPGELSDHYDPRSRSVRLSEPVYNTASVSAVSVAAHETGHALQHAHGYVPMQARSALFPVAAFSSQVWIFLLMGGALLGMFNLIGLALILYAAAVLFHVVTLPVEFDASARAKRQLQSLGLVTVTEQQGSAKVLRAAALTYVAGALSSIAMLLYYAQMFFGGDE